MADKRIMRDINLNEPVAVTLPAHNWIGFISAYASTRWHNTDANAIGSAVIDALFDPVCVKERAAAAQEEHDTANSMIRHMFTGQPPETPPHMEEP